MNLPPFLVNHPDGEIRLVGHRIGLYTIVREYKDGHSVEEIAEEYPTLSSDLIRQVIAFYLDNRGDVDAVVRSRKQAGVSRGNSPLVSRRLAWFNYVVYLHVRAGNEAQ